MIWPHNTRQELLSILDLLLKLRTLSFWGIALPKGVDRRVIAIDGISRKAGVSCATYAAQKARIIQRTPLLYADIHPIRIPEKLVDVLRIFPELNTLYRQRFMLSHGLNPFLSPVESAAPVPQLLSRSILLGQFEVLRTARTPLSAWHRRTPHAHLK